jgi:RHS repeat-associated protein
MEALINPNGKEKDFESGLYDFGFRKYSEETGRFLSVEPLWAKYPGWSPYHYCMNNPVMAKDPSGLADYYNPQNGNFIEHKNDGTNDQFLRYHIDEVKTFGIVLVPESNIDKKIDMNSNLGIVARTVYAEMRGEPNDAKLVVAESISNREALPNGAYEKADGTLSGIVKKFYDASKKNDINYDKFINPFESVNQNKINYNGWINSMSAAIKGYMLKSNTCDGVIFYHSKDPNYWDKNSQTTKINKSMRGIAGMWKLKE